VPVVLEVFIMKRLVLIFSCIVLIAVASFAQTTASIKGTVTSQANGAALSGVSVQIIQLRQSVETDDQGRYEFKGIVPGRYTLVTHIEGFSDQTSSVVLVGGAAAAVDFVVSLTSLREEVTVTATGSEESVFESFQSVNSVGGTRIREQASTSIGEVLERESGVGKRGFGPGSSRPVIRGFDGDRVLVLQDGARNGSLSSQSADHGEPVDTMNLERLEVIKGPATLLYGSNAIGGVVNAVTTDEEEPHSGARGYFSGIGATNNKQGGVSGGVEYGFKKFLLNVNANTLREGDFRTPLGAIPNSSSRAYGGGTSLGYYGEKAFLNGSFTLDRRRYGVPYAPLFEAGSLLNANGEYDIYAIQDQFRNELPETPDEEIDLRMKRNNYRLRGGFHDLKGAIERGNFYIDYTKYRHEEIETADGTDEVATNFFNDTFSYRAMFQQKKYGKLTGRFGFEGFNRSYLTEGAESLIDGEVKQNNFAVFALQELSFDRVAFQFGARVENNKYRPANTALYDDRSFTGFSGAVGARFRLWEGASFVTNFNSSYRTPALEELYNEGPHIGTVTFEIGNQNLSRERSNGIEFSLRQRLNRLRFNGSIFYYNIDNFIFLAPQDEDGDGNVDVEDNLPVGAYSQGKARFVGADVSVDGDVTKWLGAFFIADTVKAELRDGNVPLPRITPLRVRIGADLRYKGLSVRPEGVFVKGKDAGSIFPLETPTDGYNLFNVNASYTITSDRVAHIFSLGTSNLGNSLYRNHLSFIKDLAPEPGRGARFSYTLRFF
jgi:iron complex outermembrane receptor protein